MRLPATVTHFAAVTFFILTLFLLSLATPSGQANARKMTAGELRNYQYIFSNTEPNVTYKLNLNHPQQRKLIQDKLKAFGKSKNNAPQLYKSLNKAVKFGRVKGSVSTPRKEEENSSIPQDLNIISNFNIVSSSQPNTYVASALSSVVGGTKVTTIKLDIVNMKTNEIYRTITQQQHGQGTNFEVKLPATTTPANAEIDAVATISYTANTDKTDTLQPYVIRASQMERPIQGCMSKPNYCNKDSKGKCVLPVSYKTACTNELQKPAAIKVCYYRGSQQECDYYNRSPNHPTNFVFPVAGNAKFATTLLSPLSGSFTARLQAPIQGGVCTLELQDQMGSPKWTIDTANNTLNWSIDPISINDPTRCLNYMGGKKLNLEFYAQMKLKGTTPTGKQKIGDIRFTSDTNQSGQPGIYIIPQLDIEQGCIAAGSQIKLANGKQMVIEKFTADQNEQVMSEQNTTRTVLGTTHGLEIFPMKRIKTRKHTVLLTKTHPVATPKGFVMARDLKKKDKIKTINGLETIISVKDEHYKGKVYNLRVGSEADASAGRSTFYANGILVGDAKTQSYYEALEYKKLSSDPRHVIKRLPKRWHKDYNNHRTGK